MECLGRIPSFPQRSGPFTHYPYATWTRSTAQHGNTFHLCRLNATAPFMWSVQNWIYMRMCSQITKKQTASVCQACSPPSQSDLWALTFFDFFLLVLLPLLPPSLECNFSLTSWLISPTLTTPLPSILYRRSAGLDSHRHTHRHAHTPTRMCTHMHAHTVASLSCGVACNY